MRIHRKPFNGRPSDENDGRCNDRYTELKDNKCFQQTLAGRIDIKDDLAVPVRGYPKTI